MWWDVVINVLSPSRSPKLVERSLDRIIDGGGALRVEPWVAGAFKDRLNESGWLAGEEVVAAGWIQQGSPPSLLAMITGAALWQMLRTRRSKSLPREFVLAMTPERAVAFALSPWKEGERNSTSAVGVAVSIKPEERGSWPRGGVCLTDLHTRVRTRGATLKLPGEEPVPVTCYGDPSTDELVETLSN